MRKEGSEVIVTNGPLVDLKVDAKTRTATASARFFRPLESLEIVVNGQVMAVVEGDGEKTALTLSAKLPAKESIWIAARVKAQKGPAGESDADIQAREETARKSPAYHLPVTALKGEPIIQAHTNPIYVVTRANPSLCRKPGPRWPNDGNRSSTIIERRRSCLRAICRSRNFSILRTRPSRSSAIPRRIVLRFLKVKIQMGARFTGESAARQKSGQVFLNSALGAGVNRRPKMSRCRRRIMTPSLMYRPGTLVCGYDHNRLHREPDFL